MRTVACRRSCASHVGAYLSIQMTAIAEDVGSQFCANYYELSVIEVSHVK